MLLELKTKIIFDPVEVTKKHKEQGKWKKVVICETKCDIHEYYSWFLQKRFNLFLNKPLRRSHITIINDIVKDKKVYEEMKKMLNGTPLTFLYDTSEIRGNGKHWWVIAKCDDVANIRNILGLNPKPTFGLHLTIGLANEKNIDHSNYIMNEVILRFDI
jgi:hypothetical protein